MSVPCWIIHQPEHNGGIVSYPNGARMMFHTMPDAMEMMVINGLGELGFVVQEMSDAEEFRQACIADGDDAMWIEWKVEKE